MTDNITTETILCNDAGHCHSDPHIDILTAHLSGHEIIVESERGSSLYCVWVDGQQEGMWLSPAQVDSLMEDLTT